MNGCRTLGSPPVLWTTWQPCGVQCRKWTTPMCRYFRLGKCTRGDSCPFSHDLAHPDSFICPYFLEGYCKYGSRCQYDHKQPEVVVQSQWKSAKQERSTSEASTLSADTEPWRPSAASTRKVDDALSSSARSWKPSTHAAPFKASNSTNWRSGQQHCSSTAPAQDDKRPVCVYYQTGACSFGDKCRFKHAALRDPSSIAEEVAVAEHATRTLVNLRSLETLPASKQKPQVLASLNWSQACSKPVSDTHTVQVAPVKRTSAWGNSLLVNRNPNGFPQSLAESSSTAPNGWQVLDSNVDELDPWERSQNPSAIPRRPSNDGLNSTAQDLAEEEAAAAQEDPSKSICPEYAMYGFCSNMEECPMLHGDECQFCGYYHLHPTDTELRELDQAACFAMYEEARRLEEMQKMECDICLEPVLLKEDPSARCFGLLDCEHCFCLPCIRSWRGNTFADVDSATRACPTCRKKSHFVTPSPIWPATEDEKNVIVEDYKSQLQEKHCKHFDYGRGTCPFGTSCFYRHEYLDGSLEDRDKLPDVRFVTNSNGEWSHVRDNTLASAFNTARNSRLLRSRR